jgi:hypothetical protein
MTRSLIIAALALAAGWTNFAQAQDANCPEGEGGYVGAYGAQWSGRRPHTGGLYGDGWSCLEPRVTPEDLFYNYYTAANCGAWPAAMYVAPRPVPPLVGHTFYTYQPLLPHEYMYIHHRSYHRYYDGGRGLARTHVSYHGHLLQHKQHIAR